MTSILIQRNSNGSSHRCPTATPTASTTTPSFQQPRGRCPIVDGCESSQPQPVSQQQRPCGSCRAANCVSPEEQQRANDNKNNGNNNDDDDDDYSNDIESGHCIVDSNSATAATAAEGSSSTSCWRKWYKDAAAWGPSVRNSNNNNHNHNNMNITKGFRCRRIRPSDRQQIQELHEEWFPVSYQDEFYDALVEGSFRMSGNNEDTDESTALFTLLIVLEDNEDTIVAAVVGSWVPVHTLSEATRTVLLSPLLSQWNKYNRDDSQLKPQQLQFFYIMTLGCRREYRGRGLATQLLQACRNECRRRPERGCAGLYLHVWTENQVAVRMYEQWQFQRLQRIPDYYRIRGAPHACYLYARYSSPHHPQPHNNNNLHDDGDAIDPLPSPPPQQRHWPWQWVAHRLWRTVIQGATIVEHLWRHYYYDHIAGRRQPWIPLFSKQGRRRRHSGRWTDDDHFHDHDNYTADNKNNEQQLDNQHRPTKNQDETATGSTVSSWTTTTSSSAMSSCNGNNNISNNNNNSATATARRRER